MDTLDPQLVETSVQKAEATDEPTNDNFVAKEKYSKLKQRFNALRQVSHLPNYNNSLHQLCFGQKSFSLHILLWQSSSRTTRIWTPKTKSWGQSQEEEERGRRMDKEDLTHYIFECD